MAADFEQRLAKYVGRPTSEIIAFTFLMAKVLTTPWLVAVVAVAAISYALFVLPVDALIAIWRAARDGRR